MPGSGPGFARHDLVQVNAADWAGALACSEAFTALDGGARAVVAGWATLRRPAIVRRRLDGEGPDTLPLGVPLPPRLGRLRFGLSVPAGAVATPVEPPRLASAFAAAPPAWAAVGRALADLGVAVGVEPRVFGSLLWATLTHLDYLGSGSDLDLLWPVTPTTDLPRLLDGLREIDAGNAVAIDGEILLPDGAGVQWRELDRARAEPNGRALCKSLDGVSLRRADDLFSP